MFWVFQLMKNSPTRHFSLRVLPLVQRKVKQLCWRILVKLLPKTDRKKLVLNAKKKGTYCLEQDQYEFMIPEPLQDIAKQRFKHACGLRKVEAFYGFMVRDVRLIGPYGLPVTRWGAVLLEPISMRWLPHVLKVTINELGFFGFAKQYVLAIFPFLDRSNVLLDVGAHLICRGAQWPGGPVFGHWMGEQLPQIRGIEGMAKKFKLQPRIIINRDPPSWQLESLSLMGYDPNSILPHEKAGLRVHNLVFSSLRNVHSKGMECDPIARRWAAKRLRKGLSNKTEKVSNRIALFRPDSRNRRIINEDETRKIIEKLGFDLLEDVTKQSLEDSAMHFLNAETLLATFGSGITRIMFMERPRRLIEIYAADQEHRDVWLLLAAEFDMEYQCIPAGKMPDSYSDFIVDSDAQELDGRSYQKAETWCVPASEIENVLGKQC